MAENHAIIGGNPLDGLKIIGPFASGAEAAQYAAANMATPPMGIAKMKPPMVPDGSADTHIIMESRHPLDAPAMACWLLHAQIPFEYAPRWRSKNREVRVIYQFKIPLQYEEQVMKFNDNLLEYTS